MSYSCFFVQPVVYRNWYVPDYFFIQAKIIWSWEAVICSTEFITGACTMNCRVNSAMFM